MSPSARLQRRVGSILTALAIFIQPLLLRQPAVAETAAPFEQPVPVVLNAGFLDHTAELNVAQHEVVILDFSNSESLTIPGNVNVSGKLYGVSTNSTVTSASISANNFFVNHGAEFSTVLPSAIRDGLPSAILSLNLVLNAVQNIVNHGTISSSGNLTATAGGSITNALPSGISGPPPIMQAVNNVALSSTVGNIINSGTIAAASGNINLTSQVVHDLLINNIGGRLEALQGAVNVRDSLFSSKANISLSGGDILAKEMNLYSGQGIAKVDLNEISGRVNVYAGEAYITAQLGELRFGQMQITGDPIVHGESVVLGSMSVADHLLVVSRHGVTAEPGTNIFAPAGMLIRAGADYSIASDGSTTFSDSGYDGSVDLTNVVSLSTGNSTFVIQANGDIKMPQSTEAATVSVFSTSSPEGANGDISLRNVSSKNHLIVLSETGSINLKEGSSVSSRGPMIMQARSGQINFEPGVLVHTDFGSASFDAASPYASDGTITPFAPQIGDILSINGPLAASRGGPDAHQFTISHLLEHSVPNNQALVNNSYLTLSGAVTLGGGVTFALGYPEGSMPPSLVPPPPSSAPSPSYPSPGLPPGSGNPGGSQPPIELPPPQAIGPAPSNPTPVFPPAGDDPGSGVSPSHPPTITWVDLDFDQQGSVVVKNQDGDTVNQYFPGLSQASQGDLSLHLVLEGLNGTPVNDLSIRDNVSLSFSPAAFPELSISGTFRSDEGGHFVTSENAPTSHSALLSASNFDLNGSAIFNDSIQLIAFETFNNGGTIETEKNFVVDAKIISTNGSITAKTGDIVLKSGSAINISHDVATLAQNGNITLKTGTAAQDSLSIAGGKQIVAGGNIIINAHTVNLADGIDQDNRTAIASLNASATFQSHLETRQLVINPGRNTTVYAAVAINLNDSRGLTPELDAPGPITINGGPGKGTFFTKESFVYFYGGASGAVKVTLDSLPTASGLLAKSAVVNVNRGNLDIYATTTGALAISNNEGSIKIFGKTSSGEGVTLSAQQGSITISENTKLAGPSSIVIESPSLVLQEGASITGKTVHVQSTSALSVAFNANSTIAGESSITFGPNGGPLTVTGGPDRNGRLLSPNGQITLSGLPTSVSIAEIQGNLVLLGSSLNAALPAIDVHVGGGNLNVTSARAPSGDIAITLSGNGALVVLDAQAQNGKVKLLAVNSSLTVVNAGAPAGEVALKTGFGPTKPLTILNNGTVTGKFVSADTSLLLADGTIESTFGNIEISSPDFNNQMPIKIVLGHNGKIATPAASGSINISGSEIDLQGSNVNELVSSPMGVSIKSTPDNNNQQGPVDIDVRTIVGKTAVSGSRVSLITHSGDLEIIGLSSETAISVIANGGNVSAPLLSSDGTISIEAAGDVHVGDIHGGLGAVSIVAGVINGPGSINTGKIVAPLTAVSLTAAQGGVIVNGDVDVALGGFSANGGHLNIIASKDIVVNGKIDTSGREGKPGFNAGDVSLASTAGSISVSRQIIAKGGDGNGWTPTGVIPAVGGNGGNVTLDARNGKVSVSAIDVSGGKGVAAAPGGTAGKVTIIAAGVEPNALNTTGVQESADSTEFVSAVESSAPVSIFANSLYVRTQGDWSAQDLKTGALDIQSVDGSIRIQSIDTRATTPDGNPDLSIAGQSVSLVAGKEITVDGSIITNGGNVQIDAGKDLGVASIDSTKAVNVGETVTSNGLVRISSATRISVTGDSTTIKSGGDTILDAPRISIDSGTSVEAGANLNIRATNLMVAGKLSSASGIVITGANNNALNISLLGDNAQIKAGSTVLIANNGSIVMNGTTKVNIGGQHTLAPDWTKGRIEGSAIKIVTGPQSNVTIKTGVISGPLSVAAGGADIYTPNKLLVETLVAGSNPANVEARELTVNQMIALSDINLKATEQISLKSNGQVSSTDNLRLTSAAVTFGASSQAAAGHHIDIKTAFLTMDSGSSIGSADQSAPAITINSIPEETKLLIAMQKATVGCAGCEVIIGSSALGSLTIEGTGEFAHNGTLKLYTGKPTLESAGEMTIAYAKLESNTFIAAVGALQLIQALPASNESSTLNLDEVSSGGSVTIRQQLGSINVSNIRSAHAVSITNNDTAGEVKVTNLVSAESVDITATAGTVKLDTIKSPNRLVVTAANIEVSDVTGCSIILNTDNLLVTGHVKSLGGNVIVNSQNNLTVTLPVWLVPFSTAKGYASIVSESVPAIGAGFAGGIIEFNSANSLKVAGFFSVPDHLRHVYVSEQSGEIRGESGIHFNSPRITIDNLQEVRGPVSFGGAAPIKSIYLNTQKSLDLEKIGNTEPGANIFIESVAGQIAAKQQIALNWIELLGQTDHINLRSKAGEVRVAGVNLATGNYQGQVGDVVYAGEIRILSSKPADGIPPELVPQPEMGPGSPSGDDEGPGLPSIVPGLESIGVIMPSVLEQSGAAESLYPNEVFPTELLKHQPAMPTDADSDRWSPISKPDLATTLKNITAPLLNVPSNAAAIAPTIGASVKLSTQLSNVAERKSRKNVRSSTPDASKVNSLQKPTSMKKSLFADRSDRNRRRNR